MLRGRHFVLTSTTLPLPSCPQGKLSTTCDTSPPSLSLNAVMALAKRRARSGTVEKKSYIGLSVWLAKQKPWIVRERVSQAGREYRPALPLGRTWKADYRELTVLFGSSEPGYFASALHVCAAACHRSSVAAPAQSCIRLSSARRRDIDVWAITPDRGSQKIFFVTACRTSWRTVGSLKTPVAAAISAKVVSAPAGKVLAKPKRTVACRLRFSLLFQDTMIRAAYSIARDGSDLVTHRETHYIVPGSAAKHKAPKLHGILDYGHTRGLHLESIIRNQALERRILTKGWRR